MNAPRRRLDLLALFVVLVLALPFIDNCLRGVRCIDHPPAGTISFHPSPSLERGWPFPFYCEWRDAREAAPAWAIALLFAIDCVVVGLNGYLFRLLVPRTTTPSRFGLRSVFLATAIIAGCMAILRLDVPYRDAYETRWLNDTIVLYVLRLEGVVAAHVAYIWVAHWLWLRARKWRDPPAQAAEQDQA